MKKILCLISVFLFLTSCEKKSEKVIPQAPKEHKIVVGTMSGPETELVVAAIPYAKEKFGLTIKLIAFTDYISPNVALDDKSLDVNAFQTVPYMQEIMKARGYKFENVGNTFLYPIGVYSKKIKSLEQIKKGAKVAIPNDPSNEGRALLILQQAGLIKVNPEKGILPSVADVIENSKELKFITLEAAQIPRSLDDVTLAIINTNYAKPAGLVHGKDTLFQETTDSPYMNIIVSRTENKNDKNVQDFVKAFQSQDVVAKAKELFGNAAVPGF